MIELLQKKKDNVLNKKNFAYSNIKSNLSINSCVADKQKDMSQKETIEQDYFEHINMDIINQDYDSQQKKLAEKNSDNNDKMFTPSFTQHFDYIKIEVSDYINGTINSNSGKIIQTDRELTSARQSRLGYQSREQDSLIN